MQYGLIGEKLSHSYSKEIHDKIADYTYEIKPVSKEDFDSFMTKKPFTAINVTIPYKEMVIPYLDELDENAAQIGAVNTIVCENGRYVGHNTDFDGFMYMLKKHNIDVTEKKVLVLGKGGAHKAVVSVLKALNASDIITVYYKEADNCVTYEQCRELHSDASVIINTTPVGMYPNEGVSPIDLTDYPECKAVVDLIYNPLETAFLKQGKELSMTAVCGLEMLVAQAVYASEYFRQIKLYDTDKQYIQLIDKVTDDIKQIMQTRL